MAVTLSDKLLADDHRRPPPYPHEDLVARGKCALCGADRPKTRRRYCGERCSELADVPWRNRYAAYIIGRDRFGDAPRTCSACGRTAREALARAGAALHTEGSAITDADVDHSLAWHPLELDHVRPLYSLDDTERMDLRWWMPDNLTLLCHWCHAAKSAAEARSRALTARKESAAQRGLVELGIT